MSDLPFALAEATVADLQRWMVEGREDARSLVDKYLSRIEAFDRRGPELRSIIEINPDARADAARLDAERARGHRRGPLHGIPLLVKDNFATADRMMTTAGSLALVGARPPADAFVVRRLREAGVVLLGKTNMSEWAEFRSQHCQAGWSGRGGQTRNPYALDRSPMGSSAGSAVAVAANLCAAALGTETDGSIVLPANNNSVVGLKPTLGRASRHGVVPVSHNQDTPGVLARTVADAAVVLGVIAGCDRADPATRGSRTRPTDFTSSLDRRGLAGARIGVVRSQLFGNSAAADRAADEALAVMKHEGAVLIDPANLATLWQFDDSELEVLACDFKADLRRYLAWLRPAPKIRSVADVITFNAAQALRELPFFGQELLTLAAGKGPTTGRTYRAALRANHRLTRTLGIDAVMKKHRLDALVAPTGPPPALIDLVNGDGGTWAVSSPATIAAVAGYPHISVPMGYYRGLPMGISFFGRAWSEPTLIRIADAYEQATKHRRPPAFAATAQLADGGPHLLCGRARSVEGRTFRCGRTEPSRRTGPQCDTNAGQSFSSASRPHAPARRHPNRKPPT